ncbi:hypothetical protein HGRIS_010565 [Hohenbuehelia grisea]|uniref:Uncharacterized protein n=1 Tax=Hohenbuehelia grisea TaxID=104357 RepID=A0ABR3IXG5_9AGAR
MWELEERTAPLSISVKSWSRSCSRHRSRSRQHPDHAPALFVFHLWPSAFPCDHLYPSLVDQQIQNGCSSRQVSSCHPPSTDNIDTRAPTVQNQSVQAPGQRQRRRDIRHRV